MGNAELEDQVRAVQYFSRHNCYNNKNNRSNLNDDKSSGSRSSASFIEDKNKYSNSNNNNYGKKKSIFGLVNLKKVCYRELSTHYFLIQHTFFLFLCFLF